MARNAKEVTPERRGKAVDLKAFLEEKRGDYEVNKETGEKTFVEKPSKEGEIYANVSNVLHDAFENAKEVKVEGSDRVMGLETPDILAQISTIKIKQKTEGSEEKFYDMEYVEFLAKTATGRLILVPGNNDDITFVDVVDDNGKPTGEKEEVASVTRYFNQGFKVLAANAARARLVADIEGPDKALQKSAENLAKARGWTVEKAMAKIKAMAED